MSPPERFCIRFLTFIWPLFIGYAEAPTGYHDSARGKIRHELRQALHAIIKNHVVIPYSSSSRVDTSDALKDLDEDPSNTNNVILLYAQRSTELSC